MAEPRIYSYTSKDLLPCPFCGSTEAPAAEIDDGSTYLQIVCSGGDVGPGCGASSGYAPTLREAIGRWNARSNGPNDELIEARRLLARSIAAMKLGEMGIIKEIYAFLERTDATRESPE